MKGSGSQHK